MHADGYRDSAREPRVLVIPQRRGPLWLFVLACVLFGLMGAFLIVHNTHSTTLDCERDDVASARCTLVEGWPLLRQRRVLPAASLSNPRVDWSFHQDDEYSVRITAPDRDLDLGIVQTEGDAQNLARAIDLWLRSDERGRRVFKGAQIVWLLVAIGVAFVAMGLGALRFARRCDLEIADDGVELVVRRGKKTLGRILRAELEAVRVVPLDDEGEALTLVGKSHSVPLDSGAFWMRGERQRIAKQIEGFVRDA